MTEAGPIVRVRVAAIIVADDQILLARHEKNGRAYWMLPGGGVDPGESLVDALRRELREEACVVIAPGNRQHLNRGLRRWTRIQERDFLATHPRPAA